MASRRVHGLSRRRAPGTAADRSRQQWRGSGRGRSRASAACTCWRYRPSGQRRRSHAAAASADAAPRPHDNGSRPRRWTVYHGDPLGSGCRHLGCHLLAPRTRRGPRRPSTASSTASRSRPPDASSWPRENDTRLRPGGRHRCRPVVHPRRHPRALGRPARAVTSARRSASRARRSSTSAREEIFVVADELVGGAPAHYLVGLNMYTGAVHAGRAGRPARVMPAAILQRTGSEPR